MALAQALCSVGTGMAMGSSFALLEHTGGGDTRGRRVRSLSRGTSNNPTRRLQSDISWHGWMHRIHSQFRPTEAISIREAAEYTLGVSFPGKVGTAPFSSTAAQAVSGLQLTLIVLVGSRLSFGDRPERKDNRHK